MTGPEKLAEHSKWLDAHPWWRRGLILFFVLLLLNAAELLRYGLQQLR